MRSQILGKYKSQITVVDGIKFRSKKEAARYQVLKVMEKQKYIQNLRLQVPYELNPGGTFSYKYYADFVYEQAGVTYVEDTKGYKTATYKKKCALMLKVHGIKIKET